MELDRLLSGGLRCGEVTELVGPSGSFKTQVCLNAAAQHAVSGRRVWMLETRSGEMARRLRRALVGLGERLRAEQGLSDAAAGRAVIAAAERITVVRCFSLVALSSWLAGLLEPLLAGRAREAARLALAPAEGRGRGPGADSSQHDEDTNTAPGSGKRPRAATAAISRSAEQAAGSGGEPLCGGLLIVDSIHALAAASVGPFRPVGGRQGEGTAPGQNGHERAVAGSGTAAALATAARQLRVVAAVGGAAVLVTNGAVGGGRGSAAGPGLLRPALGSAWSAAPDVVVGMWPSSTGIPAARGGDDDASATAPAASGLGRWVAELRDVSDRGAPAFVARRGAARAAIVRSPRERRGRAPIRARQGRALGNDVAAASPPGSAAGLVVVSDVTLLMEDGKAAPRAPLSATAGVGGPAGGPSVEAAARRVERGIDAACLRAGGGEAAADARGGNHTDSEADECLEPMRWSSMAPAAAAVAHLSSGTAAPRLASCGFRVGAAGLVAGRLPSAAWDVGDGERFSGSAGP